MMRRSAGMPMTGRLFINTLSRGPMARALSIIFYGVGPANGPTAAIRPHRTPARGGGIPGLLGASLAQLDTFRRLPALVPRAYAGPPGAVGASKIINSAHEPAAGQRARMLPGRAPRRALLRRV